jgi:signal transduction histidine kinase
MRKNDEKYNNFFFKEKKERKPNLEKKWDILIVDDEKDIHTITKIALDSFSYKNKKLNFLSCYSAEEAEKLLVQGNNISIILLDVVMEHNSAGLDLVNFIRKELKSEIVQIILRTGHPGEVPEKEVIEEYEINDYKTKTELTQNKLLTTIRTGLRTYEALKKLKKANKELMGLDNAKNNFLNLISHEIRTPLNGIIGSKEILKDCAPGNAEFSVFFDVLNDSVERLLKLSETALIITELQVNNKLSKEKFNIAELVEECIDNIKEAAKKKEVIIIMKEADHSLSIEADRKLVIRAVSAIIDNAIKYSGHQGTIKLQVFRKDEKTIFECLNRGSGFSQKSLDNLFKPFGIGEKHYDNRCGLSLKVTKQIMDVHSGDINIENIDEGGASVKLLF